MKRMNKDMYTGGMTKFVLTEKEVLRKVSHRFIQGLFYAFQTYESLYLVFDFCHGGDLRRVINRSLYQEDVHTYNSEEENNITPPPV
jgi:serine/threonine protein kinase